MANTIKFMILPNNVEAPSTSAILAMNTAKQSRLLSITIFGKTPLEIRNKLILFGNIKMENLLIKSTKFGIKILKKVIQSILSSNHEKEKLSFTLTQLVMRNLLKSACMDCGKCLIMYSCVNF